MRTTIALNGMLRDQLRPHAASLIALVSRLIAAAIRFFPRAPSVDEREEPFELVTFGDGGRFARQSADRACAWSEAEDRERYGTTHTDGQGRAMTGRELVQKLRT